tara:strand:+ start:4047 stop:5120 length:1074 start_codon:yes stop_codon:yes gene_type:complete
MKKKLTFLGIETSCDETAASIVIYKDKKPYVISNIISSQIKEHKRFGGVVPELAARSHMQNIDFIINEALKKGKVTLKNIDGIAATAGPGLTVCLNVGLNIGKSLAAFLGKPFIAVNHLEGHALSPGLEKKIKFPYLLLLISGGHSQYIIVKGVGKYKQIGTTIDDALGEAFDKTAKILDLGYPGGPNLEVKAKKGDENFFILPRPILNRGGCNLSFAGLKTAVLREAQKIKKDKRLRLNLAASFQKTVIDILKKKTLVAMEQYKELTNKDNADLIVAGGVAANEKIKEALSELCINKKFNPIFPRKEFCGDNAAMIAWAGIQNFKLKKSSQLNVTAKSRWPLDSQAPFMKGPGLKI